MAKPKSKKILPKTTTGEIIESFGPGGGPRGMSRKTGYKIMNKFFKDNPSQKPGEKNPANWTSKPHSKQAIKNDPTRNDPSWKEFHSTLRARKERLKATKK